jgi:hypothetical protein
MKADGGALTAAVKGGPQRRVRLVEQLCYHGTSSQFTGFDDRLTFFTTDLEVAKGYAARAGAGAKIVKAKVKLESPKVLGFLPPNTRAWYARRRMAWLGQGYDGLLIGQSVVAAFFAWQISIQTVEVVPE